MHRFDHRVALLRTTTRGELLPTTLPVVRARCSRANGVLRGRELDDKREDVGGGRMDFGDFGDVVWAKSEVREAWWSEVLGDRACCCDGAAHR